MVHRIDKPPPGFPLPEEFWQTLSKGMRRWITGMLRETKDIEAQKARLQREILSYRNEAGTEGRVGAGGEAESEA